jgi:hypothetical protein
MVAHVVERHGFGAFADVSKPMASFTSSERIFKVLARTWLPLVAILMGCTEARSTTNMGREPAQPGPGTTQPVEARSAPQTTGDAGAEVKGKPGHEELPAVTAIYPWGPTAKERLDGRFAAPPGFTRVAVEKGTFAAFLRTLPLLPDGAPVVDYQGQRLHSNGHHPNIAAVADLDIGTKDLQHCADVIIRLHAEYKYSAGERDLRYRAVSGVPMTYKGYVAGERAVPAGTNIEMKRVAGPKKDEHAVLRAWLDDVFAYAGTASVERDGAKVAASDLRAGDFFVMSGSPFGHAVLVLDVAKDEKGRVALLLGQGYMPAQSFQVLRPNEKSAWFLIEPGATMVDTPFWKPFPMTSLRRL